MDCERIGTSSVTGDTASIPGKLLQDVNQRYPDAWEFYEWVVDGKGTDEIGEWPDWCYAPMAAAHGVVLNKNPSQDGGIEESVRNWTSSAERDREIATVAAVAAWRPEKVILDLTAYPFERVRRTEIPDTITPEWIGLPVWCPFFKLGEDPAYGAFVHLEYVGHPEFRALIVDEDLNSWVAMLDLTDGRVEEGTRNALESLQRTGDRREEMRRALGIKYGMTDTLARHSEPMLLLTIHVCGEEWRPRKPDGGTRTARPANSEERYEIDWFGE